MAALHRRRLAQPPFLHVGIWAGVPTAVAAVRAATEVFAERDKAAKA